jgi:hypothetical protein
MSFLRSYHRGAMKRRLIAGNAPAWLLRHRRRSYIWSAILSFPYWVSRAELKKIDDEAHRLTRMTGVPHEVNHIIPLRHPLVSGLTVPWNLEITTQARNGRIGNCFEMREENQLCLFNLEQAEQYQLSL